MNISVRFPILLFTLSALAAGCTLTVPFRDRTVSILTYNVQNLFDDKSGGNEYEEYDPDRSDWSAAEYYERLEDIARVIRDAERGGPDVVAFQEIEHLGVLKDLASRFLGGLGYRYMCVADSSSPISVGVLSRVPIVKARSHDVRIDEEVDIRPMLEIELSVRGESLLVFVCHWKSKSGGAAQTERYRIAGASALLDIVEKRLGLRPGLDIVVVGDLNENVDEFDRVGGAYRTALLPPGVAQPSAAGMRSLVVAGVGATDARDAMFLSPWPSSKAPGSYFYRGVWESIDHVLLSSGCFDGRAFEFAGFAVAAPSYILAADGSPLAYSRRRRTGFSDHLPLLVSLVLVG